MSLTSKERQYYAGEIADVSSVGFNRLSRALQAKIMLLPTSGCWLWTGAMHRLGYGLYMPPDRRIRRVHRHIYEILRGPIPKGLVLDHVCRVRNCVNPEHLRAVTQRENTMAPGSLSLTKALAERTHCKHGHPLVRPRHDGQRRCRVCARDHARVVRAERPEHCREIWRRSKAKKRAAGAT